MSAGSTLLYTSTGLVYPDTRGVLVDEEPALDPATSPQPYKMLAADRVAGAVIRAGLVYGRGGSKLPQGLIADGPS
ncbi:hypothetical protein [Nonomuraea monospora]